MKPTEQDAGAQQTDTIGGPRLALQQYFQQHMCALQSLPLSDIQSVYSALVRAYDQDRKILVFGNGGSAALASHLACDFGKGTIIPGPGAKRLRVISLADNIPLLTAWANDVAYEAVFSEQVASLLDPGDIAFAISGSGNSPNVLSALRTARQLKGQTIGLAGFAGGKMKDLCDLCIVIPARQMQIIEDLHLAVMHALFTTVREHVASAGTRPAVAKAVGASSDD
jgi:D-sedoheptulose 7-phosphate isomerase